MNFSEKLFKNNKTVIVSAIVIFVASIILYSVCAVTKADMPKIKTNKTKNIGFETFDNGLISMQIPKGWVVQVSENADLPHYTFTVYNPKNKNYRIFVNLKYEGFLKSYAAKKWFQRYGGINNPYSKMPVLAQLSAEYYYKNTFNEVAKLNSTKNFVIPTMKNFTVIQNFGKTVYGGDLLRAAYIDVDGNTVEGIFTASPKEIGTYYVRENIMSVSSKMIDTYYRNVYDTIFITAPEGEFNDWEKVLTTSLKSIRFGSNFIAGYNQAQDRVMRTITAGSQTYSKISDTVMSSWEKRNKSYDIMSQKRSDATLGYERVYDTEKGLVYKAYNGFSNDYKGKRFQPVTDEMYVKPVAGYIEK